MQNRFGRTVLTFFLLVLAAGNPMPAAAMEGHGGHGAPMDHAAMGGDQVVMLEELTVDGVRAQAHIEDVSEAMAKAGMKETHHLMLSFFDAKSGKELTEGTVAVKVVDSHGMAGSPVKMVAMDGSFGADLALDMPGRYGFEVGTKLADGKKRQFRFSYSVK